MSWGGGILAYSKSFATFNTHKEFNIIQGKIPNKNNGDVTLAVKLDGEKYKEAGFPSKEGHKFKGYECTNGVELTWNKETWKALIETDKPTICTLEFETYTSRNLIEVLKETDELVTFTHEDTEQTGSNTNTDYRYIESDPNNYVSFNNELWRIIGVFNTYDETGKYEERVKLIRDEFITRSDPYWHNDVSNRNLNDWTNASLQKYLNGEYYNSLTSTVKNQITNAKWYLGGSSSVTITNEESYNYERSNTVYSGRNNSWLGNIGLMYLSDYGFATSDDCLKIKFDNYSKEKCGANNWLFDDYQWTMTPCSRSANDVYYIAGSTLQPYYSDITGMALSKPVLYLKSNIEITGGDGTKNNPYELLSE